MKRNKGQVEEEEDDDEEEEEEEEEEEVVDEDLFFVCVIKQVTVEFKIKADLKNIVETPDSNSKNSRRNSFIK